MSMCASRNFRRILPLPCSRDSFMLIINYCCAIHISFGCLCFWGCVSLDLRSSAASRFALGLRPLRFQLLRSDWLSEQMLLEAAK